MAEFKVKTTCNVCNGTGINTDGDACVTCNQTGYTFEGNIIDLEEIDDLTDKVDDCLDKLNDIKEVVDEINGKLE